MLSPKDLIEVVDNAGCPSLSVKHQFFLRHRVENSQTSLGHLHICVVPTV
jgi:hypothetical protein